MLKRRKHSGFVQWPKHFGHRILCGNATFQTKCDMLIGPCSCGHTHRETDDSVKCLLDDFDEYVEILVLTPVNGEVKIPKYWESMSFNPGGRRCSHLMGSCMCGRDHKGNEPCIQRELDKHWTRINADFTLPK